MGGGTTLRAAINWGWQMLLIKLGLLLFLGLGMVAIALQGAVRGWLPTGRNGFKRGQGVDRDTQPVRFWFFFCLYCGIGLYVTWYGLHVLL